jgi:dipeptidyl aminopeptidase/acylaminoacyl peptidase
MGWSPGQNPWAWREANVLPDLENLEAPLAIFHGLEDQAVPVEEVYKAERRCREPGKPCFAHYYPDEDYVFSLVETWRDVFVHILKYLSQVSVPNAAR